MSDNQEIENNFEEEDFDEIEEYNIDKQSNQKQKKKKGGGFQSMNLENFVFKAIMKKGFNVPTPIQRKAIPFILENKDIIANARTGSGKTAAYTIPLINKLKSHSKIVGTRALIIVPTRELALQIHKVVKQFSIFTDLEISLIIGGHGYEGQFENLAKNPDIIIATPGRLQAHISDTQMTLKKVTTLIFDEADQLFEMGAQQQMTEIINSVSQDRQTMLFSATIPEQLSNFAKAGLRDYVFVKLDSEYTLSDQAKLHFLISKSNEKIANLAYLIKEVIPKNESIIVFTSTKYHVEMVHDILQEYNIKTLEIYGKMDQITRTHQITEFRKHRCNILVVTDLAARGLDIPQVSHIIHYDFPSKLKLFIHRSGRTARAGKSGVIYSLIQTNETMYIQELMLHINRTLSNDKEHLENCEYASYGLIPQDKLNEYNSIYYQIFHKNEDLKKMVVQSEKAFQMFKKTRKSVSNRSVKLSKQINFEVIHPSFSMNEDDAEEQNLLQQLKAYKPKESFLELKKIQNNTINYDENGRSVFDKLKDQIEEQQYFNAMKKTEKEKKKEKQQQNQEEQEEAAESKNQENIIQEKISKKRKSRKRHGQKNVQQDDNKEYYIANKKVKKSQMLDFRKSDQYIQSEINETPSLFKNDNILAGGDINEYIMADDNEELLKNRIKYQWDEKSRRFIKGKDKNLLNEDKNKQTKQKDIGKKKFKDWQVKNKITLQKEGEVENENIVNQAKLLFSQRRQKNKIRTKINQKSEYKSELKSASQIFKSIQKDKKQKILSMSKGQRKAYQKKQQKRR